PPTGTATPANTASRTPTGTATPANTASRTPTATFMPTFTPTPDCAVRDGQLPAHCGLGGRLETSGGTQPVGGAVVTVQDGAAPPFTVGSDATGSFAFAP